MPLEYKLGTLGKQETYKDRLKRTTENQALLFLFLFIIHYY